MRVFILIILIAGPSLGQPDFSCPEEFGYFPHPSDCTKYYVCVFGGALLESCTGGLEYSHELQTCDWPRNVGCSPGQYGNGTQQSAPLQSLDEEVTRLGRRSYAGSVPDYRQELVQQGPGHGAAVVYGRSLNSAPSPTTPHPLVDHYYSTRYGAVQNVSRQPHYTIRPLTEVQVSFRPIQDQEKPAPKTYRITTERPTSTARAPALIQQSYYTTAKPQQQQQQYYEPQQPQYYEPSKQQQQQYYEKSYPTSSAAAASDASSNSDSDYYVYDDDYDDYQPAAAVPAPTTTTTTRKPSRGSAHHRPTLKPSKNLLKHHSPATVRDVYLDAPSRPQPVYATPTPDTPAKKCSPTVCQLPDCNCGGKAIPGGFAPTQIPQIVMLTFDDSVNDLNKGLYSELFEKGRRNPNGCPISATFYVSHEWTDYGQVQNLAAAGHEIASHSVSHSFGEQFTQRKWDREITGQREILAAYAGIKLSTIRGMRAPFLAIGGNHMFKMLHESNWTYDSSMPVYENNPPSWPYTLDYKLFHDCMIPPCPTRSYPGVWEVPMVMWQDLKGGRCSMADACSNPPDAEGVYAVLAKNFERHYNGNRAPFGMYYHAAWFTQQHHKEGFIQFLDALTQMDDVYLVTTYQALEWVRNPTPLTQILQFEPWQCDSGRALGDMPPRCKSPKVCNLWHKSGVRYLKTCQACPDKYPWTGETGVQGSPL